jgi:hypothetical protein
VKTTGKIGKNALGFFVTRDRYKNLIFPSNQGSQSTSIKENVYGGVLRYRRDVGKNSTLGALYTGRSGDDYYNHVIGIDGYLRLSNTKNIAFQYLRSQTHYSSKTAQNFGQKTTPFGGNAQLVQFQHQGRKFIYLFKYQDLSPRFRADYGFIPRVDTRRLEASFSHITWGKQGGWFDWIIFTLRGERITDYNNNLTNQDIQLFLNYNGPLQTTFQQSFTYRKELYNQTTYDINLFETYFNMKPIGGLDFFINAMYGDAVDYSNSRANRTFFLKIGYALVL